jgi:hypothetical protein
MITVERNSPTFRTSHQATKPIWTMTAIQEKGM